MPRSLPVSRLVLVLALLMSLPGLRPAFAEAATACPALFAQGRAPLLTNPKLRERTTALCFDAFAVLHSGISRTPLYAAERLTRASVAAARRVEREDAFHEEDRLPEDDRANLSDYVHSGFDRGHLAPAGDMPSAAAQGQSFSLANIVPQNRAANRGLWAGIEESVRRLASERGEVFVVTGPVFSGRSVDTIKNRVLVPTQLYKAIYDPRTGEAGAYLAPNEAGGAWKAISLATLQDIAGIDVFPGLPEAAKAKTMDLPEPREFSRGEARGESFGDFLKRLAHDALKRIWREVMRAIF